MTAPNYPYNPYAAAPAGDPADQPIPGASIGESWKRFWSKYATFHGRASRSEFWWMQLILGLAGVIFWLPFIAVSGVATYAAGDPTPTLGAGAIVWMIIAFVFSIAVIIPSIAVTIRRLHDANFSGWFYLFTIFGLSIVTLVLTLIPSNPAAARFDAPATL